MHGQTHLPCAKMCLSLGLLKGLEPSLQSSAPASTLFPFRLGFPMLSLYSALLAQHSRQLTPVRCAEPTIVQLHRYFEDVVLENNLAALVVESLLPETQRSLRDTARVREVGRLARYAFFFTAPEDALGAAQLSVGGSEREPILLNKPSGGVSEERFVVI